MYHLQFDFVHTSPSIIKTERNGNRLLRRKNGSCNNLRTQHAANTGSHEKFYWARALFLRDNSCWRSVAPLHLIYNYVESFKSHGVLIKLLQFQIRSRRYGHDGISCLCRFGHRCLRKIKSRLSATQHLEVEIGFQSAAGGCGRRADDITYLLC